MSAHWPFDEPRNVAVFTTDSVLVHGQPIVRVSHDLEDGAWQFLPEEGAIGSVARVVGLGEIVDMDATLFELADLPAGWAATRRHVGAPWIRCAMNLEE